MIERVRHWIEQQLEAAEKEDRCVIAQTRTERERLRKAVADGAAREVFPSIFVPSEFWDNNSAQKQTRLKLAALQQLHPDWVFAGTSAACAYGLAVSNSYLDKIVVATTRATHRSTSTYLRNIIVSDDVVVERQGVRLTSLGRTVGDCLRQMDFRSGLAVADSALRTLAIDDDELAEMVSKSCPKMQGLLRARAVIALADGRAESGGESIARATMMELGLVLPELQRAFQSPIVAREHFRADFAWETPGGYVLGEFDGHEKYTNAEMRGGRTLGQVLDDEHRRQSMLEACEGVRRVVRFGYSDIMDAEGFLQLLVGCGVPQVYALDDRVVAAGGVLRCRQAV